MRGCKSEWWSGIAIVLLSAVMIQACEPTRNNENVLARIDDLQVTESHFLAAFKRYYYRSGQALEPSYRVKSSILNSEFNTLVLATYAEDEGIADSPEAVKQQDMIYRRVLTEEYMDRWLQKNAMITEDDMRAAFTRMNTMLRASHIYARDKETADSLYNLIREGVSFEEVARSSFRNRVLAESGGDLGVIRIDETDPAFEKTAFSLEEGEISEPVRTAQGYSIIKVTRKTQKPITTETEYAQVKDRMAYFADRMEKELAKRAHMQGFLDATEINEDELRSLQQAVSGNYSAFSSGDEEFFASLSSSGNLIRSGSYRLTASEFAREAYLTPQVNLNRISDTRTLKNLIKGIAYRNYLLTKAESLGLDEDPDIQASLDQTWYVWLAEQAISDIRSSIEVSDEEMLEYYASNTDRFERPLEINLSRIVLSSEEEAREIHKKITKGADFGAMVDQYTIKNEERLTRGELGFKNIREYGVLSPKLSVLNTGEISEPLFYQSGEYHIYKVLGRNESRLLRFGEARTMVEEALIREKLESKTQTILEEVKKRHNAVVNEQKLRELTIQI